MQYGFGSSFHLCLDVDDCGQHNAHLMTCAWQGSIVCMQVSCGCVVQACNSYSCHTVASAQPSYPAHLYAVSVSQPSHPVRADLMQAYCCYDLWLFQQ